MLTYQDLFEIVRKEKYSEMLQQLPKQFHLEFIEYLQSKKENYPMETDLFLDDFISQSHSKCSLLRYENFCTTLIDVV